MHQIMMHRVEHVALRHPVTRAADDGRLFVYRDLIIRTADGEMTVTLFADSTEALLTAAERAEAEEPTP